MASGTPDRSRIIESPPLVEVVRERIIEDIMERRYRPGDKLPVQEVSARYGVSETPVKQAFNRLVSEGMLEALPRRGVIVRRVTKGDVQELMEARQMVNLLAADASIDCPEIEKKELRDRLEKCMSDHAALLKGVEEHLAIETFLRYVEIDRDYHMAYLCCVRNRPIEEFYRRLYNQAYAYVSLSNLMVERIRLALEEHREIYAAWSEGNRERMIDAVKKHKDSAIRTLDQIYQQERQ